MPDAGQRAAVAPVSQALKEGDNAEAVRQMVDFVVARPGYFATQPAAVQALQLDNAHTMPLLFSATKPPQISCAELGQLEPRVALARGGATRPFYVLVADAGARCMPHQPSIVLPMRTHMWPGEDVAGFSAALVEFLKGR